jgi:hypothetical protein
MAEVLCLPPNIFFTRADKRPVHLRVPIVESGGEKSEAIEVPIRRAAIASFKLQA